MSEQRIIIPTIVLRRRGTTEEHKNFIGEEGEITIDTDKKTVVVHDGKTPGGFPLGLRADHLTEAERDALTNVTEGFWIYNTDIHRYQYYDGTTWRTV